MKTLYRVIREKLDPISVISEYVDLKTASSGKAYGRCPFHGDTRPSFYVYPDGYHCFGCKAHGDIIDFYARINGISYREAALELYRKTFGKEPDPELLEAEETEERQIRQVLLKFARLCWENASANRRKEFAAFLKRRQFDPEFVHRRFRTGYCSEEVFDSFNETELRMLKELGVTRNRWAKRITIPVVSSDGKAILSILGRTVIENDTRAKYLNVAGRSRYLFATNTARRAIRETGKVLIVEGPFDAIRLHSIGVNNTVALLGSGTHFQAVYNRLVGLGASKFVVMFDGDEAGYKAAIESLKGFIKLASIKKKLVWRCVLLPEGMDPDSYYAMEGKYNPNSEQKPYVVINRLTRLGVISIAQASRLTASLVQQAPHLATEVANGKSAMLSRWKIYNSFVKQEVDFLTTFRKAIGAAINLSPMQAKAVIASLKEKNKNDPFMLSVLESIEETLSKSDRPVTAEEIIKKLSCIIPDENYWLECLY